MGIYCADNLGIMRRMDAESVDLIATDPPYCTGRDFGQYDDRWVDQRLNEYVSLECVCPSAAAFIDYIEPHDQRLSNFLTFLSIRLVEMRRILKSTGSIYLQCDPTASHPIKMAMDAIFGRANFRNEIVWCYTGPSSPAARQFPRKHDTILWYSKGKSWTFNADDVRVPYKGISAGGPKWNGGERMTDDQRRAYLTKGKIVESWWSDISVAVRSSKERTGYPTQKPIALYERIIKASCHDGGIVLDPFCGSGTTLVAAKRSGRQHIGIDESFEAVCIAERRVSEVMI